MTSARNRSAISGSFSLFISAHASFHRFIAAEARPASRWRVAVTSAPSVIDHHDDVSDVWLLSSGASLFAFDSVTIHSKRHGSFQDNIELRQCDSHGSQA